MVNEMNDMTQTTIPEHVSALADGQLRGDEFARAVQALCAQDELRERWQTWHLVGDVLREGRHLPCTDTARFVATLSQRLAAEPLRPQPTIAAVRPAEAGAEAANEPVFRWKLIAGVASVAAAAAIGWNWVGAGGGVPAGAQLARQQQPAAPGGGASALLAASTPGTSTTVPTRVVVGTDTAPQVMLRDARLDQMLAAHQQAGGASQMPSGFLRNATFEGPSR
jgi:sigma-E factor negative regulatory protein RseA